MGLKQQLNSNVLFKLFLNSRIKLNRVKKYLLFNLTMVPVGVLIMFIISLLFGIFFSANFLEFESAQNGVVVLLAVLLVLVVWYFLLSYFNFYVFLVQILIVWIVIYCTYNFIFFPMIKGSSGAYLYIYVFVSIVAGSTKSILDFFIERDLKMKPKHWVKKKASH